MIDGPDGWLGTQRSEAPRAPRLKPLSLRARSSNSLRGKHGCWKLDRGRPILTSLPDITRSLPNGHLKLRDEHVAALPCGNFFWRSAFEKQLNRLA